MGLKEIIRENLGLNIDPLINAEVDRFLSENPTWREAHIFPESAWLDVTKVTNPDGSREVVTKCIQVKNGKVEEGPKFTFTARK